MPESQGKLKHLLVHNTVTAEDYTSPKQAPRPKFPERDRREHSRHLLDQLNRVQQAVTERSSNVVVGVPAPDGVYLEIEGKPGFDLKIQSLDLPSSGIELLSVKKTTAGEVEQIKATVFVPQDKISVFIKKVEQYRSEDTRGGSPKNKPLVESISDIRLAVIQSLWTDLAEVFPHPGEKIWWEVWLRATADAIPRFQNFSQSHDIQLGRRILRFPDRHVILAYTSATLLASSIESLGFIAELRRAKETTSDFLQMNRKDQQDWVDALSGLLDPPVSTSAKVCVLDTGVHKQHSLIDPFLDQNDIHACDPSWGGGDHHGHGTSMAGLVLFGSLEDALQSSSRVKVPAKIESVKILPPNGQNHPELYGSITEEAISRATIPAPNAERILCMAITSTDDRDRGQPSSWSAAVDKICSGQTVENKKHLFIISAGNVTGEHKDYPSVNLTESVHDPGQAWNAITVGAFTDRGTITETSYSAWKPLAEVGDIAPATTTTLTWQRNKWPIKPEVVFEGGNAAIDSNGNSVDYPDSLSLLTTTKDTSQSMFTWFGDTSAAAAQGAHFSARVFSEYQDFWPETIRALMVHSAEWTPRMRQAYPIGNKTDRESLLRICGFGVPSLEKALWSARNSLTLIAQEDLKPFETSSMNEMNMHALPWPTDVLRSLGETTVRMKVTLSYFIEPNPARRGWDHKFRYQSHGLRFDVKTPTESTQEFMTRLNRERWDEERGQASVTSSSDTSEWFFGKQTRSKGSLHSDWWEGNAASLADRSQIAIYPVVGWWRERHSEGHTSKRARYSLIVTIETPDINTDIYTPVATQVVTPIEINR